MEKKKENKDLLKAKKTRNYKNDDIDEDEKNEKRLTKKLERLDVNKPDDASDDSAYVSESDPDSEEYLVDDYEDNSEDLIENEDDIENSKMNKDGDIENEEANKKVHIWNENNKLKEQEELDFDNEAYDMLHRSKVEWPCMSIDFVLPENFYPPISDIFNRKNYNLSKDVYPYESYMVAGSQTSTNKSYLYYMKWFNMHKTKYDDDPDKGAESDEDEGGDPYMRYEKIQIKGNVNRLKTMKNSYLCAYWSDLPSVEIVDLRELINNMEDNLKSSSKGNDHQQDGKKKRKLNQQNIHLKSFKKNLEGFALNWSPLSPGVLASGGLEKRIDIYLPVDETCSDWVHDTANTKGIFGQIKAHKASVEDIEWSPNQNYVLASCSVDRSIKFWDLRSDKSNPPMIIEEAHESDVNCLSWNTFQDFMVASGGDDGAFKVWDIRYIKNGPISNIKWHSAPITAISWDPYEDSQIVVSSEDNRLSIWDFAVEPDDKHLFDENNQEIPQQLIFLHQGQNNIKDVKFHPIYRNFVVSTAEDGINVFKPAFDDEGSSIDTDSEMDEI